MEETTCQENNQEIFLDYTIRHKGNENRHMLAEAQILRNDKALIPNNWDEGFNQRWAYLILFQAIHGLHHCHVDMNLFASIKVLVQYKMSFKKGLTNLFGCYLGTVKMLHYFHASIQQ